MRRWVDKILSLFLVVLLLVACSTKKKVTVAPADVEKMEFVSQSPSIASSTDCISGNVKFTAVVDGKPMTTRGTLRITADEGIRIGITALGLVEVACLEFLPENARLIYKIGKVYSELPYNQVSFLQESGIDYRMLVSVLMNRLFSPGMDDVSSLLTKMQYSEDESCITAQTTKMNGIVYKFFVDKNTGNLVRSEGLHDSGGRVVCRYSDFALLGDRPFPRTIELELEGVDTSVTLQFVLLRVNSEPFDFAPQEISSSYEKTDITDLINSLENN